MFTHGWYTDHQDYPNKVADMVGYWAENRIFGGVVLFNHNLDQTDAIYLHPNREFTTYRICRLLPEQQQALLQFACNTKPVPNPLPILVDKSNTERFDPEERLEDTGVYRDLWERRYRPYKGYPGCDIRPKDVFSRHDYPVLEDRWKSSSRAHERKRQWEDEHYGVPDVDSESSTPQA
jgi:hypothetical protein